MAPKVSVIIPTYNREHLIGDAISSVLSQSYDDYEIIVVDDGSADGTGDVVAGFDSHKIRYFVQENRGRSTARNKGIMEAHGEYIAFLDSDDLFLPNKLALQIAALESAPTHGMIYSQAFVIDESGASSLPKKDSVLSGWIYPDLLFIRNNLITTPTAVVRSAVLKEVGGFDEAMDICEDLDLWRRIARKYRILQLPVPVAKIRVRSAPLDVAECILARSTYFEKALQEDPSLPRQLSEALKAEMNYVYAGVELRQKNQKAAFRLIRKCVGFKAQHLKYVVCFMFEYARLTIQTIAGSFTAMKHEIK